MWETNVGPPLFFNSLANCVYTKGLQKEKPCLLCPVESFNVQAFVQVNPKSKPQNSKIHRNKNPTDAQKVLHSHGENSSPGFCLVNKKKITIVKARNFSGNMLYKITKANVIKWGLFDFIEDLCEKKEELSKFWQNIIHLILPQS